MGKDKGVIDKIKDYIKNKPIRSGAGYVERYTTQAMKDLEKRRKQERDIAKDLY